MTISEEVLDVLRRSTIDATSLLLPNQLERKEYEAVAKVLKGLGVRWDKKAKRHLFDGDSRDVIMKALDAGKYVDPQKELNFFETPATLAARMVLYAVKPGNVVLEPSAGEGAICQFFRMNGTMSLYPKKVYLVEIDENRSAKLERKFGEEGWKLACADFLAIDPVPKFDAIVMNPPFKNYQDIAHILHAWECLKDGGRLAAISAISWTFRDDRKANAFKQFVEENKLKIEYLPRGTFSETDVMAVLLTGEK